jgi:hypothetical protein
MPYGVIVAAGKGVVVPDDVPTVMGHLGSMINGILKVLAVPEGSAYDVLPVPVGTDSIQPEAITTEKIGELAVTYEKISYVDPLGIRPYFVIARTFVVGIGGGADDIVIYDANAPFPFRVLDAQVLVTTVVPGGTITIRNAKAGGGVALSDDFSTAALGRNWDYGTVGITPVIPAGGTLVLRRSNNLSAGEMLIPVIRVP